MRLETDSTTLTRNPRRGAHVVALLLTLALWRTPAGAAAPVAGTALLPSPKRMEARPGRLLLVRAGPPERRGCRVVAGPEAGYAAEVIAARLGVPVHAAPAAGELAVRLRTDAQAPFAAALSRDARPEAYCLEVTDQGVEILAVAPEGLLRAAATLLQLLRTEEGAVAVDRVTITDWPDFRFRCAADWLINVECNRWSYDWGDGYPATLARIRRKLDQCFAYKINQVWFDGFGWDTQRSEGYAQLMRECAAAARQRGIRLTFAGYGGGYGIAYQPSELYRTRYFGQTFFNRTPYPDGPEYSCRGMRSGLEISRRYGTCLCNEGLAQAKLEEMCRFAAEVEPGFMYIHDIDSGTLSQSVAGWRMRCGACRERWPSDGLADPRGMAGAMAGWFGRIRRELDGVTTKSGYRAARDLTVIFISPLYTEYTEKGGPELWQREADYFFLLSRLLGPVSGVQFGLREQFYKPDGGKKIAHLRAGLDQAGCGHGIHIIAFLGGDHYLSDDLVNLSALMAPFYGGAESVCLSNGGVHEDPVQLLNAEQLWSGSLAGYRETVPDEPSAQALARRLAAGRYRPAELFAPDGFFERLCRRLWGDGAGREMCAAYRTAGETGEGPVSRVWWTITREMAALKEGGKPVRPGGEDDCAYWRRRRAVTGQALAHAQRAAALNSHEDLRWFARCLELGARFSECLELSFRLRAGGDAAARAALSEALDRVEALIAAGGEPVRTDPLGGDPGCWRETAEALRKLNGL